MPCSRRKVRFMASAVNVVDITAMPAMPGTITFRSCWLPCRMAPKKARNSSGSRKLKKAALGLRQNSRRSSRYWRQASQRASVIFLDSGVGGQLQIDILERGPGHREAVESLPARQSGGGQLAQQRGG